MPGIFSYCHTPINLLSNFDDELQNFFKNVIGMKQKEILPKEFNEALRLVTVNECPPGKNSCFDNSLHRMVYMFRFSPCYTSAVAKHFLRLVNRNPMIFRDAMWRRQVNICCLGGGPGTEVVALSKILFSAQDCFWQATKKPLHLQITIVDQNRRWKETAIKVLRTLKNSAEIFDEMKMKISFRFVVADLTEPLADDVLEAIQEADIVTMVKVLSVLRKKSYMKKSLLVKDIAESMKPDGVLFYLDTGMTQFCYVLYKSFENLDDIECIYGPKELEVFTLTLHSIRKNIEYFWEMFHGNICLTSTIINSCAWIKTDGLEKHPSLLSYTEIPKRVFQTKKERHIHWQNKALMCQEKLRAFHQRKVWRIFRRKGQDFEEFSLTFLSEYPSVAQDVLFCNKSKSRRLFISTNVRV